MKKSLLAATLLSLALGHANAQIKLGNNPTTLNADALLEIESTNKGLLLPRVALTNTTAFAPLTAHVAGMTVYNTATAGDVTPGTYYNDGTKWVRIASSGAATTTLYSGDGILAGAGRRTVTMGSTGNNLLSFTGTAGEVMISNQYTAGLRLIGSSTNRADIVLQAGNSYADWYVDNNNIIQFAARGNALSFGTRNAYPINFATNNRSIDMSLDISGNLGIGTTSPGAKLEVAGQVKITGGTPGAGKVLTSDATGLATWAAPAAGATGTLFGAYNPIGTANLLMAAGDAEADVPGVTQTFTLTQAGTVNIIATGIVSNYNVPTVTDIQGSFKINVDGNNLTAAFASSGHRPGLGSMPTPITLSYNVVLAAGTHTIKLRYKPWYGGANLNENAYTVPYVGSVAIDADALKSRMSILIFNN
jgi:hypothetical protein